MKPWMLCCVISVLCLLVQTSDAVVNSVDIEEVGQQTSMTRNRNYLNITYENYPRVDGSTSAHPLQILIACELLGLSCYWNEDSWEDRKYLIAEEEKGGISGPADFVNKRIRHHGTHGSYVNLIENNTDLILVARRPSQDEINLAAEEGVGLVIEPVALDAFVFVVNYENIIDNLGMRDIQDIYSGNITNWREVGGNDVEINPYQRNKNSGSQVLMEELVMKGFDMIDSPQMMILEGMMGPINQLSEDVDGVGYSVYFFEEFMAPNERIKLIGIDGVFPDYGNISTKEYALTTEVYTVIRDDLDSSENAFKLRDWLLTDEGQRAVRKSGYVPLEPINENDKGTPTLQTPEIDELEEICYTREEFNITWSEMEGASTYVLLERYGYVYSDWGHQYCGKELLYNYRHGCSNDVPRWFRVKAMGMGYKDSLYSKPYIIFPRYSPDYIMGPPVEFLHGNRSLLTGNYWINWTEAPNTTKYDIHESAHLDFRDLSINRWEDDLKYHISDRKNGTYYYRVRPRYNDSIGPWSKVIAVHVGVSNSPPSINVSIPGDGDTVSGNLDIRGMIYDDNFHAPSLLIQMKIGEFGPWMGITNISDNGQWQYHWDTSGSVNGNYALFFRGFDGELYSTTVTTQVRVSNLLIEITYPKSEALVSRDVNFEGSLYYDIYNINEPIIQMKILGWSEWENIPYVRNQEVWSYSWNASGMENRNYTLFFRAIQDGNISDPIHMELKVRNTILTVNSPTNGDIVKDMVLFSGTIEYEKTGSETPIIQIRIGTNGTWENIINNLEWYYLWNTSEYLNGNYIIFFRVVERGHHSGDKIISNSIQLELKVRHTILTVNNPFDGDILSDVALISGTLEYDETMSERPMIQIRTGPNQTWTNITNMSDNFDWIFMWNTTGFDNGPHILLFRVIEENHQVIIIEVCVVVNNSKNMVEEPVEMPDDDEEDQENDDGNVSGKKKDRKKSRSGIVIFSILALIIIGLISIGAYVIVRKKFKAK